MTEAQPLIRQVTGRKAHLPALDGLRGIAIIGVLLFHTGHLVPGGFLGVDLFFALSGHLITDLLLREVERTGTVSLIAFWGRRVRRLLPALAAMLTVVTVVVWVIAPDDVVRTTLSTGPWVQLNLINWHLLAESVSYWNRFGSDQVFEHLWSIAVEEQFYLLWPALMLLLARRKRNVAVAAGAMSVLSLVLMIALFEPADPTRVYTGTDTRAFSLLLGALVATRGIREAVMRFVGRWAGAAQVVLGSGIAVLWWLADGENSAWLFNGGLFAHSAASALLILLSAQTRETLVTRALGWSPLRWFGQLSYSLYLWHWPVFVLLSPELGLGRTVLAHAVSIGLAASSKYLVEDPIRFRARWATGRSGVVAFVAVTIVLAALWLLLPAPAAPAIDVTRLN